MNILDVVDLRKRFVIRRNALGRPAEINDAVRGVSFSLVEGETLALVGESGAGKSTVGRLILRLIDPDSGTVTLGGKNVTGMKRRELASLRRDGQMIFQDPYGSMDPRQTALEAVSEPLLIHTNLTKRERQRQALGLLERVGISPSQASRYSSQLSGGQLQRVAIARALSLKPRLIVCDEAVSALDVSVQAQVINLMKDLQSEFKLAYLFITHDLALVEVIADRVAVMRDGEIVEQGVVREVFANPSTDYTSKLLTAIPNMVPRSMRA